MRVLVIRLGALGDFFLSFPAFAAIRAHDPAAEITLLTTAPFAALARAAPWFDRVLVDARPARLNLLGRRRLARRIRGFDLVVDLQTSARSSGYFPLAGRPPWSGIAPGCSLPHDNPARDRLHTIDRQADQLCRAGIAAAPAMRLDWLAASGGALPVIAAPYAVLVPGAAPHRPAKRWPVERFRELARALLAMAVTPVVAGAASDRALGEAVTAGLAGAVDLTGRTDLGALARLMAGAAVAVGNDTGPMHVAASVGCPAAVLFSEASDPALTAPRSAGPGGAGEVRVLQRPALASLETTDVLLATLEILRAAPEKG